MDSHHGSKVGGFIRTDAIRNIYDIIGMDIERKSWPTPLCPSLVLEKLVEIREQQSQMISFTASYLQGCI
jgi:hypothetical protein